MNEESCGKFKSLRSYSILEYRFLYYYKENGIKYRKSFETKQSIKSAKGV